MYIAYLSGPSDFFQMPVWPICFCKQWVSLLEIFSM